MNYARPMTTVGSRFVHRNKKVTVGHQSDSDENDEEDVYISKQNGGYVPVKGQSDMFYKVITQLSYTFKGQTHSTG